MSVNYLHLLNLDTVGGVEELFMHFLAHSASLSSSRHHLLITGSQPHSFFAGRLNSLAASQTLEKYLYNFKIIRPLRSFRRKRALKISTPHKIVLWNRIESIKSLRAHSPNSKIVYYEHGASWIIAKRDDRFAFFTQVDELLVNSIAAKRVLELKWDVKAPITIVQNPLKPTLLPASIAKDSIDLSKRPLIVGFIGRLIPLKGVPLLLHAIKHLIDQKIPVLLRIVGDGPSKEALQKEIHRLNLTQVVSFLGCIQDVSSFYDKIDVLAVPSIREPLGLVAQEALLRGCPVVASFVDGLPEIVTDKKTGFTIPPTLPVTRYKEFGGQHEALPDLVYDPLHDTLREPQLVDPMTLAARLLTLAVDSSLYRNCSAQAIEYAKGRPSFRQYTEELMKILSTDSEG